MFNNTLYNLYQISFGLVFQNCFHDAAVLLNILLLSIQATERMKIVDVLGAKQFTDGERIITQVRCAYSRFGSTLVFTFIQEQCINNCFLSQGDKADCFYVVESGEVKIMMKSKVRSSPSAKEDISVCTFKGRKLIVTLQF